MERRNPVIGVLAILAVWLPLTVRAQDDLPAMSMDVTGQAVLSVPPDQAVITFTVETTEKTASAAVEKNARLMARIIEALKKASGDGVDVSTAGFSLQPVYHRQDKSASREPDRAPEAYRAINSTAVKTGEINRIGGLIDTAVAAGAIRVGSPAFSRGDSQALQRQAALMAMQNAVDNARILAQEAGVKLGEITYIQFVPSMVQPGETRVAFAEMGTLTPVIPGQITFESYVNLTYKLVR